MRTDAGLNRRGLWRFKIRKKRAQDTGQLWNKPGRMVDFDMQEIGVVPRAAN